MDVYIDKGSYMQDNRVIHSDTYLFELHVLHSSCNDCNIILDPEVYPLGSMLIFPCSFVRPSVVLWSVFKYPWHCSLNCAWNLRSIKWNFWHGLIWKISIWGSMGDWVSKIWVSDIFSEINHSIFLIFCMLVEGNRAHQMSMVPSWKIQNPGWIMGMK